MNIFWLDSDLEKCVHYHMDKHVVKMCVEYAQLLSTASRLVGLEQGYKASNLKHPCQLWLQESQSNWVLLYMLEQELGKEFTYRYHKIHSSVVMAKKLCLPPLPKVDLTIPKLAMPNKYKDPSNPIKSYRDYYLGDKRHLASWKDRPTPEWWI